MRLFPNPGIFDGEDKGMNVWLNIANGRMDLFRQLLNLLRALWLILYLFSPLRLIPV